MIVNKVFNGSGVVILVLNLKPDIVSVLLKHKFFTWLLRIQKYTLWWQ